MTGQYAGKPVFLIGYRATGKSSAGRRLAGELDVPFYDMDDMIQQRAGRSIREIVRNEGWSGFRVRERELLSELVRCSEPAVVACGGGAVLHEDVFEMAGDAVRVVWLKADADTIMRRLSTDPATGEQRPALMGGLAQMDEIKAVLEERTPLYSRLSHYAVDTSGKCINDIVEAITVWLEKGT